MRSEREVRQPRGIVLAVLSLATQAVGTKDAGAGATSTMSSRTSASSAVLAYLFTLRRARHPLPHAWTTYFNGCPSGSYSIHVHIDPTFNSTGLEERGPAARYFNHRNTLPQAELIKVHRFGFSLVQARMKLLRHATSVLKPPAYYIFLSESCAPIATCATVHEYLSRAAQASPPRSFVGEAPQTLFLRWLAKHEQSDEWRREFETTVCTRCRSIGILASSFRFSPGWVTLYRAHAALLVRQQASFDDAFAHWTNSKLAPWCTDEVYWSTLLQHLHQPVTGGLMTYMEPGDAKTGHSRMFREANLTHLWSQPAPFFFARKFPTTPWMDAALTTRIKAAIDGS